MQEELEKEQEDLLLKKIKEREEIVKIRAFNELEKRKANLQRERDR